MERGVSEQVPGRPLVMLGTGELTRPSARTAGGRSAAPAASAAGPRTPKARLESVQKLLTPIWRSYPKEFNCAYESWGGLSASILTPACARPRGSRKLLAQGQFVCGR